MQMTPKIITLDAEAFNSYLVSDGLPHVYRLRAKEKSLDQPAVERYSKSPKHSCRWATARTATPPSRSACHWRSCRSRTRSGTRRVTP
ncbi:MAG: hypothetical protein U0792_16990 [Gemmataceae bacterium]